MDKDVEQVSVENDNGKQGKIYWHDAFYEALKMEFHDYSDHLIFEDEHQLSKEALIMDVLVIKKTADVEIDKNIGEIFKGHNIIEYKSETDSLSVWDYNKVVGYAMIYSAFEEVAIKDITISFVVTPKPVKLFEHLINDRGFTVSEPHHGVYYIHGDFCPVQIIESKKLSAEENIFLKSLRSSLTQSDLEDMLQACSVRGSLDKVSAFLNRVLSANEAVFREVLVMSATVRDIVFNQFEMDGTMEKVRNEGQERGHEKAKRETALELLNRGFGLYEVADIVKMPIEWVQNLAQ